VLAKLAGYEELLVTGMGPDRGDKMAKIDLSGLDPDLEPVSEKLTV
jgi:hypothetical protein